MSLKKGNETIQKQLDKIYQKGNREEKPEEQLILVVSRSKYLIAHEYDAFIFKKDRILIIKNVDDKDLTDVSYQVIRYTQLNPGKDQIEIKGEIYKNRLLISLLKKISNIYKNPQYNTRNRILTGLESMIVQETQRMIKRPSVTAETDTLNSAIGFLDD